VSARGEADVVVIGLGVLGASTLRQLARDGLRVIGVEQFAPGHVNGSSHGRSRAVRFLYHAPEYVALLQPAIEGWRDLEAEFGRRIYWNCGTLFFARPGNPIFGQNLAVMASGGLRHELLDEAAVGRRFPAFSMPAGARAVFNEDGGMVDADAAVAAFIAGARSAGAEIRHGTRVRGLDLGHVDAGNVRVQLDGETIAARHVVVAAGAWTSDLLPDLASPIRVTQQSWFTMRPRNRAPVEPSQVPVWCDYDTMYYGFPDHGPGLKIADDTPGREVDPHGIDRPPVSAEEERQLTSYLGERFPSSILTLAETGTCLYTLTPDEDFLLGVVPGSSGRASVVVGLNHAFKFAPVIGRILADLAATGTTPFPIERFGIDRFAAAAAS
jgi:sarcosine oxidase